MAELDDFLRKAKQQGATDEFLVALLKQQGWPEKAVYESLGRLYEEATGVTVPQPQSSLESAREAFYHLLAFATLGAWTVAIASIWFSLIDVWLPDRIVDDYRRWSLRSVSFEIAAILVSFPIFVVATRSILRDIALAPDRAASGVRRWLTNIALLITVLILSGDLIAVLAALLQGELTARFLAKSAVVLVVAGGVFLYYTRGLTQKAATPAQSWHRLFATTAGVLILVTLGLGFWKTGTPVTQRQQAEDLRRLRDLSRAYSRIDAAYNRSQPGELPKDFQPGNDPVTNKPYEYIAGAGRQFQLCAEFNLPSPAPLEPQENFWRHPAGRHCFTFTVGEYPGVPTER